MAKTSKNDVSGAVAEAKKVRVLSLTSDQRLAKVEKAVDVLFGLHRKVAAMFGIPVDKAGKVSIGVLVLILLVGSAMLVFSATSTIWDIGAKGEKARVTTDGTTATLVMDSISNTVGSITVSNIVVKGLITGTGFTTNGASGLTGNIALARMTNALSPTVATHTFTNLACAGWTGNVVFVNGVLSSLTP